MKFLFLEIYAWKIKKFTLSIQRTLVDAIDICLGFWTIVIYYKPENIKLGGK